ncbi:MAG: hypothetical protein HRJ53_03460 [Acidobacteria bacterium Pan2503]|uniref:Uncharacterized protein n=1 Tax=Candidatus Acidiferrum panamense TaxID=2741543 RepID=A0A7V8SVN3_9BACT|nr:hypothetical protein [Candidatus Acidoferrum panamensis]
MNMDFYGYFEFGDADAVRQFVVAHYFTHEAEATALAAQFGRSPGTFNVSGMNIVDEWIGVMDGTIEETPRALNDWLEAHNDNHQSMAEIMGTSVANITGPVDLSIADFSNAEQLYEWLTLHQQMHQFEQVALKLT